MDLGSAARALVTISNRSVACVSVFITSPCRQEALSLQEKCAQTCTAQYRCRIPIVPLTIHNVVIYRAPELFEVPSSGTITAASDVWSLGCCIYAAAFGHSPFDGSALAAMSGRVSFPREQ